VKYLPDSANAIVVRTDFSDAEAWDTVCAEIRKPSGDFRAYVDFVSDPEFEGVEVERLPSLIAPDKYRSFIFLVDRMTLSDPEHPVLVVDLLEEPGRTFRVIPHEMWSVENNLSLANLDFQDFYDSVDSDGIFRGFPYP
jgi:uncharacterized protein DUF6924